MPLQAISAICSNEFHLPQIRKTTKFNVISCNRRRINGWAAKYVYFLWENVVE